MSAKNHKYEVSVEAVAGNFAEDKDVAKQIRLESVLPRLCAGEKVVLDFTGVSVATQSFVHAIISEAVRKHGAAALELIEFKGCNPAVQSVVLTVVGYSVPDEPQGNAELG